jgi:hypothetical protein
MPNTDKLCTDQRAHLCRANCEPIEAIEGELVFLIRQRTGDWPRYQNEIHFTNSAAAKKIAVKIYSKIQRVPD